MSRRTVDQMYLDAEFVPDAVVRRWFPLPAEERQVFPDKPAGWLPATHWGSRAVGPVPTPPRPPLRCFRPGEPVRTSTRSGRRG